MNILEKVKIVLESDAGLLIEDITQPSTKKIVDNRFFLIKQNVDSLENKDDIFYDKLIKLIANYIDRLYDNKVKDLPRVVLDKNGEKILQDYDKINLCDAFKLTNANMDLAENLFNYICSILESNPNIILDIETLKRLLNRNPKLFMLPVEESYIYRPFDYQKLVEIINKNQSIEKSNISIEEVYQILLDTYQINNDDVFVRLVKPKKFIQNHQKIDEILTNCNARTFVEITNVIRRNFDKHFDRLSIAKKRKNNNFCERLIFELLKYHNDEDDFELIHQILTDSEIEIDYDLCLSDYVEQTDLKSIIALSGNKKIIKDLLSKEQNIQSYYNHGEFGIALYKLYAIIGDYEKALANFEKQYNFKDDLDDDDHNWDKFGYTYGSWSYKDSLASFVSIMCASFKENKIDYSMIVNIINRIINNENVKYINLEKMLTPIQEVLSTDDFKLLVDTLLTKHNSGNLEFLTINDHEGMFVRYIISIASEDEIQSHLMKINKVGKNNILSLKKN